MSKPSSTILAARALARRMGIANAHDPENSAGPSVETPDAAAPVSTPVQASPAPAPAPAVSRASEAM
ncbi:hypothetical protein PF005_g31763 [Phytophthora fragariae]|uniref:Uncharacterized protein n=1 Tax=Phytophthora fragariae TaxID=53985 RepID=A0A6A3VJF9_9STRA|nr:hypothetical protein PF005_g31763 [Phytophthora fragariae]KAE9166876.1 hypothetical protein PF002_g31005 [Phytophthora fragariae]